MYITEVSIRRPVVAWVLSLILIVFGLFVYSEVPVRELPDGLQPPVVQVKVDYKSASAPIIDQEITQVIEDVIGGAEGIKNIDKQDIVNASNLGYIIKLLGTSYLMGENGEVGLFAATSASIAAKASSRLISPVIALVM